MTPGDRMQNTTRKIEKKCLSCMFGRQKNARDVVCGYSTHPGIVGGAGSEWVLYCYDYTKVRKP